MSFIDIYLSPAWPVVELAAGTVRLRSRVSVPPLLLPSDESRTKF